jgi:hypothetical protein
LQDQEDTSGDSGTVPQGMWHAANLFQANLRSANATKHGLKLCWLTPLWSQLWIIILHQPGPTHSELHLSPGLRF